MNREMNGKEIIGFQFTDSNGNDVFKKEMLGITKIFLSATYHGDHNEFWIVVEKDGKETERHNCKFVHGIVWKNGI